MKKKLLFALFWCLRVWLRCSLWVGLGWVAADVAVAGWWQPGRFGMATLILGTSAWYGAAFFLGASWGRARALRRKEKDLELCKCFQTNSACECCSMVRAAHEDEGTQALADDVQHNLALAFLHGLRHGARLSTTGGQLTLCGPHAGVLQRMLNDAGVQHAVLPYTGFGITRTSSSDKPS